MTTDPFRTAELRSAVLNAWERSPARFREDANTEEDHATGYYRDRVIVELAQNAADAAARAGVPGRLALRLVEDDSGTRLVAANTGAWLDADGVASLASLRASAKTAPAATLAPSSVASSPTASLTASATAPPTAQVETVGRFGVGFAAVRAVSDEVTVSSRSGGVRFSLAATTAALAPLGVLTEHVAARAGTVPILRVPFPAPAHTGQLDTAPAASSDVDLASYDTVVILELRDAAAIAAVRDQLAAIDDTLLLALPALASVHVDDDRGHRELSDVGARWIAVTRSGVAPAEMLRDRPVEERSRAGWTLTWAYPRDLDHPGRPLVDQVVRAPTPTDEPLSLPAILLATFPLDPSRRHVADAELTRLLVREAGEAYAVLALGVPEPLDLVPTGLPRGRLDGELCAAAEDALRRAPVVAGQLAQDTVVIEDEVSHALVTALEPTGLGVVQVDRSRRAAIRRLGAQMMSLADVVDALPDGLRPRQWHDLYDALAPYVADRAVREALTAILVPLEGGGTARGPRGLVMGPALRAGRIEGVHRVHPDAAHPLLLRLGAVPDDDPAVLGLAAVELAARRVGDELLDSDVDARDAPEEVEALYGLVAGVARENRVGPDGMPGWLGDLPLPSDEGVWQRASELSWPGSWADEHLDLAAVDAHGIDVLTAEVARVVGVRFDLAVREVSHETGRLDEDETYPGWADYDDYLCAVLGEHRRIDQMSIVADLDVVADDSWGAVLDAFTRDSGLRRAVLAPVRAVHDAAPGPVPREEEGLPGQALSYTAWYLRDLFGAPWAATASAADDVGLRSVLPPVPDELAEVADADLVRALGGVASLHDLAQLLTTADPATWFGFFDGLRDGEEYQGGAHERGVGRVVPMPVARIVWAAFERSCRAGLELDPLPELVVAVQGLSARIVAAEDVLVTDGPMWVQVRAVVPVVDPESVAAVAAALDCAVADSSTVTVHGDLDPQAPSTEHPVPAWIPALVPGLPATWTEHTELSVDGRDVDWWVSPDSAVHVRAGAPPAARAQAFAQAAGRWGDRYLIELALRDVTRSAELMAERVWDERR
ncbi:hypothetical protein SAMN05216410_2360 [Sanguibacter gelidistatuariae]|uniref:Uncharacterized protein n=1 Tax=Sanguibacter gelidistatuariae TaxID=1814289 RepID=A0A1G6PW89_9MICO|nr:hypothetical protein [Sanguibacter gelidistatuariae]SDC83786.1 hypothetical protein SAMN05216410_2360 [Sanguibacter gelidistatuariae]